MYCCLVRFPTGMLWLGESTNVRAYVGEVSQLWCVGTGYDCNDLEVVWVMYTASDR